MTGGFLPAGFFLTSTYYRHKAARQNHFKTGFRSWIFQIRSQMRRPKNTSKITPIFFKK